MQKACGVANREWEWESLGHLAALITKHMRQNLKYIPLDRMDGHLDPLGHDHT
jgi:hypothetical protein